MRLLEHKSKELLKRHGINVPKGELIGSKAVFNHPVMLKAQIASEGRQKNGGVLLVENETEYTDAINKLSNIAVDGFKSEGILSEEIVAFDSELYFSLGVNTSKAQIELLAKRSGGINVETSDDYIFTAEVSTSSIHDVSKNLCKYYGYDSSLERVFFDFLEASLDCMVKNDLLLLEINPLAVSGQRLIALDCKAEFDDNARYRHSEYQHIPINPNFVLLNQFGNTAVFANGAGLAMATVDEVHRAGLIATNFLDIGGGADARIMQSYFEKISAFPQLTAVIINVFAGITRCDEVAQAVIDARASINNLPPLYIRLHGTGYKDAKNILDAAGVPLYDNLDECIKAVNNV